VARWCCFLQAEVRWGSPVYQLNAKSYVVVSSSTLNELDLQYVTACESWVRGGVLRPRARITIQVYVGTSGGPCAARAQLDSDVW
jgi:hypothetical protein